MSHANVAVMALIAIGITGLATVARMISALDRFQDPYYMVEEEEDGS